MRKNLSEFLTRFDEVQEERGEYMVPCPVHDDRAPSLAFRLKDDGRLLVRCWAGCDVSEIRRALEPHLDSLTGWEPGEGVKASAKPTAGDVAPADQAALAMYVDQTNQSLLLSETAVTYVAERFGLDEDSALALGLGVDWPGSPYTFPHRGPKFQRFPRLTVPLNDFDGIPRGLQGRDLSGHCPDRWLSISNPEGAAWSKYGVFRAGTAGDTILLTEGPSDALTAVGAGYDAVFVRGASLANNPGMTEALAAGLKDRDVVFAVDRDPAGEKFGSALADTLTMAGVVVRVAQIPNEGDDLGDWRERDPEQFASVLAKAVKNAKVHVVDPTPAPTKTTPAPAETKKEERRVKNAFPCTDLGNAERLFHQLGGHVRKVEGADVFKWTGKKWDQVPTEALYADVRKVIDNMMSEDGDKDRLGKWWSASQDAKRVRAMVDMLSSIPGVYARVDQFDAIPYLMPFNNCVVDLRDGSTRPHDPADMNTFVLDLDYDPDATAPRFLRFLQECHPASPEMPKFLQRMIGYGITGYGVERAVIMHVGPTTNGKTTFTGAIEDVFAAATKRADASLFMKRREGGGPRADVVGLRGSRLVISSEWPANMPLDQALMKAVSGDQSITARGVYAKKEITFRPTCLVQVDTNYAPEVDATDAALWQRVRVVPWEEDFRGREDRHLTATLRKERAGIAAWAVQGAIEWYAAYQNGGGLEYPECVEAATAGYRESSHPLAGFIGGDEPEFVEEEDGFVPRAQVWVRYQQWAEDSGVKHTFTRNKLYAVVRTVNGVVEAQGTGKHKGVKGFKGISDAKAVERPVPPSDGPVDMFGQRQAA